MIHYKFKCNGQIIGAVTKSEDQARNRLNTCFTDHARIRRREIIEYPMELISTSEVIRAEYHSKNKLEIKMAYYKKKNNVR